MGDYDFTTEDLAGHIAYCILPYDGSLVKYVGMPFEQDNVTPSGEPWTSTNIMAFKVPRDPFYHYPKIFQCFTNATVSYGGPEDLGPCGFWRGSVGFDPPVIPFWKLNISINGLGIFHSGVLLYLAFAIKDFALVVWKIRIQRSTLRLIEVSRGWVLGGNFCIQRGVWR